MRVLILGSLVLGGLLFDPSLAMAVSSSVHTQSMALTEAVRQQPVSTIPPLPQGPPRFSTIPPLQATPTPMRPVSTLITVPTQVPAVNPSPTRAAPAPQVVPQAPVRQTAPAPAPSRSAPSAGGVPLEMALVVFTGSTAALGGGLYLFRRSRKR